MNQTLHELTRLVLATRPENLLGSTVKDYLNNIFHHTADAHVLLLQHAEELRSMYPPEEYEAVMRALEYDAITSGEACEPDPNLPAAIQYALDMINEHDLNARMPGKPGDA